VNGLTERSIASRASGLALISYAILAIALPPAAGAASATQKKVCSQALKRQFSHRPRRLTTAPPAGLTSILGVLQSPATPADKLPAEAFTGIAPFAYSSLWLGSVRLLDAVGDKRYFLIPGVYAPLPLPEACVKLESPHERRLTKGSQLEPRGPVVTLEAYSANESGGIPYTASAIQAGTANDFAFGRSGPDLAFGRPGFGRPGPTTAFYGLVPDGVASVTVTVGGASPTAVPAANNFFLTQIPAPSANEPYTITQQWYAADGTLIKTVSRTTVLKELSSALK
jgi:hypothetical protein